MTTTKHLSSPNEELHQLVQEGEALLANPNEIRVTFQQSDIDQADCYRSNTNCYLCVALRRMGQKVVSVGGSCARINSWEERWFFDTNSEANPSNQEFGRSIVGKTLVLRRQPLQ